MTIIYNLVIRERKRIYTVVVIACRSEFLIYTKTQHILCSFNWQIFSYAKEKRTLKMSKAKIILVVRCRKKD